MQPTFILQYKETLTFMNVRCFEKHEKLRRAVSLLAGHIEGGLWAEGTQDGKDTFYCVAVYTFLFLNLLNVLHI